MRWLEDVKLSAREGENYEDKVLHKYARGSLQFVIKYSVIDLEEELQSQGKPVRVCYKSLTTHAWDKTP